LELTILQFLVGVLAGTASGLVMVLRRGSKKISSRTTLGPRKPLPTATRHRASVKSTNTRTVRARSRSKPRVKFPAIPLSVTVPDAPIIATNSGTNISSCPGCGLEAPGTLMAEHFMGSPSHQYGTPQTTTAMVADTTSETETDRAELDDDPKRSLRNLLQMLVPPRAFGHRQQQRTVNPLSRLVQTLEVSQSALVHPLKGPR